MNSKNKIGVFDALMFGVMMLLIPATSIANAQQEYNDKYYYEDDEYVYEEYYFPPKDKKMKEPPMLLVKKDVLYCDSFSGSGQSCFDSNNGIFGPDSGRYVQTCTSNNAVCNNINETSFNMIVTDNIEFPGSEDGKKINFNGERYTVIEEIKIGEIQDRGSEIRNSQCQEAGFDSGFGLTFEPIGEATICVLNEGKCSGIVEDGELKECTFKNYIVGSGR